MWKPRRASRTPCKCPAVVPHYPLFLVLVGELLVDVLVHQRCLAHPAKCVCVCVCLCGCEWWGKNIHLSRQANRMPIHRWSPVYFKPAMLRAGGRWILKLFLLTTDWISSMQLDIFWRLVLHSVLLYSSVPCISGHLPTNTVVQLSIWYRTANAEETAARCWKQFRKH